MDHVVVLPWRMNYGSLRAIGGCGWATSRGSCWPCGGGGWCGWCIVAGACRPSCPFRFGPFVAVVKTGPGAPCRVTPAASSWAYVSLLYWPEPWRAARVVRSPDGVLPLQEVAAW